MKALIYDGSKAVYREDYPMPALGGRERSLIKILMSAVCNTDKEVIKGYKDDFSGVMGHEFVGMVQESDDKKLIGRRVVAELNSGCGECLYCRTGRMHHCTDRKVPGMSNKDGCFAEYMSYDTSLLHVVPDEIPTEKAIFCEPLAAALEISELVHMPPSQKVAVMGDGRLAYMIAQVVAANGTPVKVFGLSEKKLKSFADFAETSTTPSGDFETVIDATGSPLALATSISLTRSKGTLVLKSTYAGNAGVNMSEIVVREIRIVGSRCGPFEPALNLIRRGLVKLPDIELHGLKDYEAAFTSDAFKAGFTF